MKPKTRCSYCEEPICEDYCIDLREYGLGCFHKECAKKDDDVLDKAMELLIGDYKTQMDLIDDYGIDVEDWE